MYRLKLHAQGCINCGICMDVCPPNAIGMRIHKSRKVEGRISSYLYLNGNTHPAIPQENMMTFPYMAHAERCDGCKVCVEECPVSALEIGMADEAEKFMEEVK